METFQTVAGLCLQDYEIGYEGVHVVTCIQGNLRKCHKDARARAYESKPTVHYRDCLASRLVL